MRTMLLCLLVLIATGIPAQSAWTDDLIVGAGYARSFEDHTAAAIVTVGFPVFERPAGPLTKLTINAEMNAASTNTEEFQGGPGLSVNLSNQIIALRVGVTYIPGDLGLCWVVGINKSIARW